MSILADAHKVPTEVYDVILNNIYKPYMYLNTIDLYKKGLTTTGDCFGYSREYKDAQYNYFEDILIKCGEVPKSNGWYFIFIADIDRVFIYAHNPKARSSSMRSISDNSLASVLSMLSNNSSLFNPCHFSSMPIELFVFMLKSPP